MHWTSTPLVTFLLHLWRFRRFAEESITGENRSLHETVIFNYTPTTMDKYPNCTFCQQQQSSCVSVCLSVCLAVCLSLSVCLSLVSLSLSLSQSWSTCAVSKSDTKQRQPRAKCEQNCCQPPDNYQRSDIGLPLYLCPSVLGGQNLRFTPVPVITDWNHSGCRHP